MIIYKYNYFVQMEIHEVGVERGLMNQIIWTLWVNSRGGGEGGLGEGEEEKEKQKEKEEEEKEEEKKT